MRYSIELPTELGKYLLGVPEEVLSDILARCLEDKILGIAVIPSAQAQVQVQVEPKPEPQPEVIHVVSSTQDNNEYEDIPEEDQAFFGAMFK